MEMLVSLWQYLPPELQMLMPFIVGAWFLITSKYAAVINAEIRALREAGEKVPVELIIKAAKLNALAYNPDKAEEAKKWKELGGIPSNKAELDKLKEELEKLKAENEALKAKV